MENDIEKIVLAYSGGLDTSVILSWLKETYQCPVIAYAADLGQGEELDDIKEKAVNTGAEEAIALEDLDVESAAAANEVVIDHPDDQLPGGWIGRHLQRDGIAIGCPRTGHVVLGWIVEDELNERTKQFRDKYLGVIE